MNPAIREELRSFDPAAAERLDAYDRSMRVCKCAMIYGAIGTVLGIVALLFCLSVHAEPRFVEIEAKDECRNWSTNPTAQWVNDSATTYAIASVDLVFGGADSLVGEMGMWLTREGARPTLMYSFPQQAYAPPTVAIVDRITPPKDARFTIEPGERVQVRINCGPVSIPGWRPFVYYGVAKLYLVERIGK
jgi:hypothetical protein